MSMLWRNHLVGNREYCNQAKPKLTLDSSVNTPAYYIQMILRRWFVLDDDHGPFWMSPEEQIYRNYDCTTDKTITRNLAKSELLVALKEKNWSGNTSWHRCQNCQIQMYRNWHFPQICP